MTENIYINPQREQWDAICARCRRDESDIVRVVGDILREVRRGKDRALRDISLRIDGIAPESFEVSSDAFDKAEKNVSAELKAALQKAAANIAKFHRAQLPQTVSVDVQPGVTCIQRAVPLRRVGIYIPGGKAPLFSTILMLALPAKIAGCREIVMCTPLRRDGTMCQEMLYAARLCGVTKVFAIGGAQAIAAMAYGTESVPRVDKIFGPGNRYVTTAKQLVASDTVAIDMPAGPSEVMVLADSSCEPAFVAADLLSQAEHGDDSQAVVVADSRELLQRIIRQLDEQKAKLPRRDIVEKALENSRFVVFDGEDSRNQMIEFAYEYAPEHLIISTDSPWNTADKITSAGSVFIGNFSPESAGDYASGTNHTLPTSGWARSYSGVNIDSFMRKITYQYLTPAGLRDLSDTIIAMAEAEGLQAHANAVIVRTKGGEV